MGGWRVGTVAGTPSAEGGYADGSISEALFSYPQYIALSKDQTKLYVTELNDTIRVICLYTQTVSTLAGSSIQGCQDGDSSSAQFNFPAGVAIDSRRQRVVVADADNHVLRYIALVDSGSVATQDYYDDTPDDIEEALPSPPPIAAGSVRTASTTAMGLSPAADGRDSSYARNFRGNLEKLIADARRQAARVEPFIFSSHYFQAHPPDLFLPLLQSVAIILRVDIPADMDAACDAITSPGIHDDMKGVDLTACTSADMHELRRNLFHVKHDAFHDLPDIQNLVLWLTLCEKAATYNLGHRSINRTRIDRDDSRHSDGMISGGDAMAAISDAGTSNDLVEQLQSSNRNLEAKLDRIRKAIL